MLWNNDKQTEILQEEVLELKAKLSNYDIDSRSVAQYNERLADVEVKIKKLWDLLTEKTPTGKERLNRYGKTYAAQFHRS